MNADKLAEVLRLHSLWLKGEKDGTRADLTGANLTGANLTGANLTGANLTYASLTGTDLTGAKLTGTDLTGAKLTGTDLTGAKLPKILAIENIRHSLLERVTQAGCKIKMDSWHDCDTVHCLAGWAVTIHPEGRLLESIYGTGVAAVLILNACGEKIPNFYDTGEGAEERAMSWLKTGEQK